MSKGKAKRCVEEHGEGKVKQSEVPKRRSEAETCKGVAMQ